MPRGGPRDEMHRGPPPEMMRGAMRGRGEMMRGGPRGAGPDMMRGAPRGAPRGGRDMPRGGGPPRGDQHVEGMRGAPRSRGGPP